MLAFIIGLAAIIVVNLITDHAAQREGFDELSAGTRLGS
jgi:hypothetical protein